MLARVPENFLLLFCADGRVGNGQLPMLAPAIALSDELLVERRTFRERANPAQKIAVVIPWTEANFRLPRPRHEIHGRAPALSLAIHLLPRLPRRLNENEIALPHSRFGFVVVIRALA